MIYGTMGRILDVDLSTGRIADLHVSEEDWLAYLGGKGLGVKLLFELLPPGVDPLSPDNVLVFTAGILTGTRAPCSSRYNLSTKSPLTHGVSSSNCGGTFGTHLRWAGYDGLVVRGRADHPVRLEIRPDRVRILDARHLWGLDTVQTTEAMGGPRQGALVIGPAGEHLVRFASIMDGHRTLGRTGTGAVMGSKLLKAITASGNLRVPVAKPDEFERVVADWTKILRAHPITGEQLPSLGTAGLASVANATYTLPVRNFQAGHVKDLGTASGEGMADTILVRNSQCRSCPIRCARVVKDGDGEAKGPEYETLGMFGPNQGIFDVEATARLGRECDRLGLDTISAGATVAFAMELTERGLLPDGPRFGDVEASMATIQDIAYRRGLGAELAEGTMRVSKLRGGEAFAMHAKGLEFASYDPRGAVGLGLGYAVSNRGGCHIGAGYTIFFEALGPLQVDPLTPEGKPALVVMQQNLMDAVSAAGNCIFTTYAVAPGGLEKFLSLHGKGAGLLSKAILAGRVLLDHQSRLPVWALPVHLPVIPHTRAISAVTGRRIPVGKFLAAGERAFTMERLFNLREGFTAADDSLPDRLTKEPNRPGREDSVVPMHELLPKYYRVRDWDERGVPRARLLRRLGLDWLEPVRARVARSQDEARTERAARVKAQDEAARELSRIHLELARDLAQERGSLAWEANRVERATRAGEVRGATFSVVQARCAGCGLCHDACPVGAIDWEPGGKARIRQEACVHCGLCEEACPPMFAAILRVPRRESDPEPPIYRVDAPACRKCGLCFKACPVGAITWRKKEVAVIHEERCVRCGLCFDACPPKWAAIERLDPRTGEPIGPVEEGAP